MIQTGMVGTSVIPWTFLCRTGTMADRIFVPSGVIIPPGLVISPFTNRMEFENGMLPDANDTDGDARNYRTGWLREPPCPPTFEIGAHRRIGGVQIRYEPD